VLGVIFDVTDVLLSLTVISTAEDVTTGVTRWELLAEITVGVLIHFLISITVVIVVVISTTTTTSVSTVVVATVITTVVVTTSTIIIASRVN
jgi:riboflavin transporter FmnP